MVKLSKVEKLEKELKEVKELIQEFKKRNGNASIPILNKDILLLLLTKTSNSEGRIAKLEAYVKILLLLVLATYGVNIVV